jgi:hypothetical protein
MDLCYPGQRGKGRLTVGSRELEELYEAHPSPFTLFHHQDHFHIVHFLVMWHSDISCKLRVLLSIN